jgi:hypothetical protein
MHVIPFSWLLQSVLPAPFHIFPFLIALALQPAEQADAGAVA